ncbi:hypothetical protein PVAP13_4KG128405 [Panicum virgatum]|uniref:Uncharacterized protein n=1 Tax=Panicum virgatum TaxID=38727 RepID=A0A8T0TR36_PANVG|nr:hypothetical protein PVAP13_4KG128405 [Panicum virgatum]
MVIHLMELSDLLLYDISSMTSTTYGHSFLLFQLDSKFKILIPRCYVSFYAHISMTSISASMLPYKNYSVIEIFKFQILEEKMCLCFKFRTAKRKCIGFMLRRTYTL